MDIFKEIRKGNLRRVEYMIDFYGVSHVQEYLGKNVLLLIAQKQNKPEIVQFVTDYFEGKIKPNYDTRLKTLLHLAVEKNYTKIVEMLLKEGAEIDAKDSVGKTPLHYVCKEIKITELLLNCGADVNSLDHFNRNPLHSAAEKGHLKTCEIILNRGANIEAKDFNGRTPLFYAINNIDVMKLLLDRGADVNSSDIKNVSQLHAATKIHKIPLKNIKLLLKRGANIEAKDINGETPLHYAATNTKITKLLLDQGANVNATDYKNVTPLHIAAKKGCLEAVDYLLKRGADINSTCKYRGWHSCTTLQIAICAGFKSIVQLLLKNGANIETTDTNGVNSLNVALMGGNLAIVQCFLKADINYSSSYTDENGYSLLHLAAEKGNAEIVNILLSNNVDINVSTVDNLTPLYKAVEEGQEKMVNQLLENGANVDFPTKSGKTVLQIATEKQQVTIIENILKYCPDVNNKSNKYSLNIAVCGNGGVYVKIVETLLRYGFTVDSEYINDSNLMHNCVEKGYLNILEDLLIYGANVDSEHYGVKGYSLLHSAVRNQQQEIAKLLIDYGADLNIEDETYGSPIFHAVENNDIEMVKLLISNGTDMNIVDDHKRTALQIAVERDNVCYDIKKLLERQLILMDVLYKNKNYSESISTANRDFQQECETELSNMKSEKFGDSKISYHDILLKNVNQVAIYVRNEKIVQAFNSNDYKTEFPIYAHLINCQIRKGMLRKVLMEQGSMSFNSLVINLIELPYNCVEKILNNLSNDDIRMFINTCKTVNANDLTQNKLSRESSVS